MGAGDLVGVWMGEVGCGMCCVGPVRLGGV